MDSGHRRSLVDQIASFEKVKYFTTCRAVMLMLSLLLYLIVGAVAFQQIESKAAKQRQKAKQQSIQLLLYGNIFALILVLTFCLGQNIIYRTRRTRSLHRIWKNIN